MEDPEDALLEEKKKAESEESKEKIKFKRSNTKIKIENTENYVAIFGTLPGSKAPAESTLIVELI